MPGFRHAHAVGGDWRSLCDTLVERLSARGVGGPALGFIYLSHTLGAESGRILEALSARLDVTDWVGSLGMGVCSTGLEVYDEPSIAVLLTDIDPEHYRLIPNQTVNVAGFIAESRAWRSATGSTFGVIHGDPSNPRTPDLITQLAERLDPGFLVGGLTSSSGEQVQFAGMPHRGGVSGVMLAGDVSVTTGLTQGCSLIGEPHVITECRNNIVVTLDGKPALEVLKRSVGEILARDLQRLGGYIFAALPIAGSDTGDYRVRNLIGLDPNQGLVAIGDLVEPGQRLQFARRDPQTAHDDLMRMLDNIAERLPGPIRGGLYHSCLGRGENLFGAPSAELQLIESRLGAFPLIGFYANGEISRDQLYGYTGVLTLFT